MNNDLIVSVPDKVQTPIMIFIIICFFCIAAVIIYKSSTGNLPSVSTIGTQSMMTLTSCAILVMIGFISVSVVWFTMVIFVSMMIFITFHQLMPEV